MILVTRWLFSRWLAGIGSLTLMLPDAFMRSRAIMNPEDTSALVLLFMPAHLLLALPFLLLTTFLAQKWLNRNDKYLGAD
jgi:hypothetical protein